MNNNNHSLLQETNIKFRRHSLNARSITLLTFIVLPMLVFGQSIKCHSASGEPAGSSIEKAKPLPIIYLEHNPDEFQRRFDAGKGIPRLVVALSSACGICIEGADFIVDALKQFPDMKIAVHFIWLPAFKGYNRDSEYGILTGCLKDYLQDKRITHYWDPTKLYGYKLKEIIPEYKKRGPKAVVWDTWIAFDQEASWQNARAHVLGWGRTIRRTKKQLKEQLQEWAGEDRIFGKAEDRKNTPDNFKTYFPAPDKKNNFAYVIWVQGSVIRDYTEENLKFIANHFNYLEILRNKDIPEIIAKLKSYNSNLKLIQYTDGIFTYPYKPDPEQYPDCYAYSPNSSYAYNRIKDILYGGYLMDVCSDCWKNYYLSRVRDEFQYGYDGVFVDDFGILLENRPRFDPPATDFYQDEEQLHNCKKDFISYLDANLGDKLIIFNGLFHNQKYLNTDYLSAADGGLREGFIAKMNFKEFCAEREWKIILNSILTKIPPDKLFIAACKLDFSDGATVNDRMFCFTSYLLIQSPNIVYFYTPRMAPEAIVEYYPEMNVDIGEPMETKNTIEGYLDKGVYVREFTKGKAVVNPSNIAITYPLDRAYNKVIPVGGGNIISSEGSLSYEEVSGKITISPQTGVILLSLSD